jgi:hypothetical protein
MTLVTLTLTLTLTLNLTLFVLAPPLFRLSVLYIHLHGRLSEFPFTTLLRHGPAGRLVGGSRASDEAAGGAQDGGGDGDADSLPVVLVRLPYKPDPESECGGPESPYFLKVAELRVRVSFLFNELSREKGSDDTVKDVPCLTAGRDDVVCVVCTWVRAARLSPSPASAPDPDLRPE